MRTGFFAGALLLGAALFVGCDDEASTTPAAGSGASMTDKAKEAGDKAKDMAGDAKDAVAKQAQEVYDKVKTAIDGKKFDEATKLFDQLKGWKDKLPAEWATKIDDLGALLEKGKSLMPK